MQRKDDAERIRREQLEAHRDRVEATEDRRVRRELEREEAERQRDIDAFWRSMKRKVKPERETGRHQPEHDRVRRSGGGSRASRSPIALPAYSAPIVDRGGRVGVFMSSTYLSARTSAYGCMKRLSYYVTKPESLERVEGEGAFFSNMGETRHEIAEGMTLVEDANRAARANAKVAVTFIVQLPHDVTPRERLRILRIWCEEKLGVHDLPYVAALHKPSEKGDKRNHHGHVVTSFRPAYRTGQYAWRIARGLRSELDNPAMFEEFRRDFATIMTAVVQLAGKDRIYTHLSHAARGLKHKPTEKLGPHKTKLVRQGEHVPANARNARTIATNEARAAIEGIDERNARRRRHVERLAALKAAVARPPSLIGPQLNRDAILPAQPSQAPGGIAIPQLSMALLAKAARVEAALPRRVDIGGVSDADGGLLTGVSNLHDAAMLDESVMRTPSSVVAVGQLVGKPRAPSRAITAPERAERLARSPAIIRDIDRQRTVGRLPSERVTINEPAETSGRRPSAIVSVKRQHAHARSPSTLEPILPAGSRPKMVSQVAPVSRSQAIATPPSPLVQVEQNRAAPAKRPTVVKPGARGEAACRSVSVVAAVERGEPAAPAAVSTVADVERHSPAKARVPRQVRRVEPATSDPARSPDVSLERVARIKARIREAERDAKTRAQATALQAAEAQRLREYDRYLRFLALIALNPDWLKDGEQGLAMAPHAPQNATSLYASWQNDHQRLGVVAEVRQAVLDGVHRLPAELARDIARTAAELSDRLPAPPPLRDARGRLAPAVKLAMALVADTPRWAPAPGEPVTLAPDAPPALVTIVARYAAERSLPGLLASAACHGQGEAHALEVSLARRLDYRCAGFALRRARGKCPVVTAEGARLAPGMVEHLARGRLHAGWVVHHPELGLGVGEGASRLFREQWMQWTDPQLARRLLIDNANPPAASQFMTPAMRAQIMAEVQMLAGSGGSPRSPGRDIDRSR